MKWTFVIQQKLKASLLMVTVMALVIVGNLLSRNEMQDIDKSFASIYKDRLIPATTITYLAEHLYGKRLALEKYLLVSGSEPAEELAAQLRQHNESIDSLVSRFESTYLVDDEAKSLLAFKSRMTAYTQLEGMVIGLEKSGEHNAARQLFDSDGLLTFQSSITRLNELTSIQSNVGMQLMRETKSSMAGFSALSFLQIALAVLIGLIVLGLISNAGIINKTSVAKDESGRFHLN